MYAILAIVLLVLIGPLLIPVPPLKNTKPPEALADPDSLFMDRLCIQRAILLGHSAGGAIACLTALRHPGRVQALILVSPTIYSGGGAPGFMRPFFNLPQVNHIGPLLARSIQSFGTRLAGMAFHDPSRISPDAWAGYAKTLQVENWDRALWEFTRASQPTKLPEQVRNFKLPVLVIAGDGDRIVPTAQSVRLAREMPCAELVVVPECGHVAHEEAPSAFMQAVATFLGKLT